MKDNSKALNLEDVMIEMFKSNMSITRRAEIKELYAKYPIFSQTYEDFLKSEKFIEIISKMKNKYENHYVELFFRHSINYLDFYLRENDLEVGKKNKRESRSDETESED
jgi:hypothetical protein